MNDMTVSVIVPVYNAEKYLNKCIDSIISQSYDKLEIILINDGSLDSSGKILDEYAKSDARIKVIHKKNGGIGSAYNSALEVLTGSFLCFVDSDDYIHHDMVSKLIDVLIEKNADIVHAGVNFVNDQYEITDHTKDNETEITGGVEIVTNYLVNNLSPSLASIIFRKELFNDIVFFEQNLGIDVITTPQLLYKCKKIYYVKERYYYCYQAKDSVSREKITLKNFNQRVAMFDQLYNFFANTGNDTLKSLVPKISMEYLYFLLYTNLDEIETSHEEKQKCITLRIFKFKEHYKIYRENNRFKLPRRWRKLFMFFNIFPSGIELFKKLLKI